jgi:hypothetical protein
MKAVPTPTPHTSEDVGPTGETTAIDRSLLLHDPPVVRSVKVAQDPLHRLLTPLTGSGEATTVKTMVPEHPVLKV